MGNCYGSESEILKIEDTAVEKQDDCLFCPRCSDAFFSDKAMIIYFRRSVRILGCVESNNHFKLRYIIYSVASIMRSLRSYNFCS